MRLVTVAHGTRHPTGNRVAASLTAAAATRLGVRAQVSYVELCEPLVGEVLGGSDPQGAEPTVLVPLLLTTGYHVRVDLPAAAERAPDDVVLTAPLGPDPLLAAAQVDRLLEAGAVPGQPVVLVAAGSRDPAASPELERAAALLEATWGGPVRLATLSGAGARLADVAQPGDAVSPYLLAEGFFAARCAESARAAGAAVVAGALGEHPSLAEIVVERYQRACTRATVLPPDGVGYRSAWPTAHMTMTGSPATSP